MSSVLSAIFWGVLLLSLLVFVHEGGHYLAARASGMRVTEFFLGMPCKARLSWRSKKRGTEFGITPILLGGYTKICGMEGTPSALAPEILAYISGHGSATPEEVAQAFNISEDDAYSDLAVLADWGSIYELFAEDSDDVLFANASRDANLKTIYDAGHDFSLPGSTKAGEPFSLGALTPEDFYIQERKATYLGKSALTRLAALLAGPAVNIVLGFLLLALTFSLEGFSTVVNVPTISAVVENSAAANAGLMANDTICSVDGEKVLTWEALISALDRAFDSGEDFDLEIEREGSANFMVTIKADDLGEDKKLGIYATTEVYHPSATESLSLSWRYVQLTVQSIFRLLTPTQTASVVSQSSSVVGISVMASEAAASGALDFLYILAAVSLSLGFMNLIPIPPLDGGKILFELIQLVSRRNVPERVQLALSYVGLALVMVLFVFVLRNDIITYVLGG